MLAVVDSVALVGIDGHPVRVEVSLAQGLPTFTVVGLPDAAVREARERVRAAVVASGFEWPRRRLTVNLAPAGLPKSGSWFDLPVALGILSAAGAIDATWFDGAVVVGELGLGGELRPVPGVLAAALCARKAGRTHLVVAAANAHEAVAVPGVTVSALERLGDAVVAPPRMPGGAYVVSDGGPAFPDLGDVAGHGVAKLGLQIAAAGGHHCLLVGPPGSGKTMLARRLPGILPALSEAERIEVSSIHTLAGASDGLLAERPFRSPHHSATVAALVGGGSERLVPGEVSLAHCGVLFLDELGEFRPSVLDALRQPLEDGRVQVCRRSLRTVLPARFTLVAATNPCPCGHAGSEEKVCECDVRALARYRRRLSGPLLDRVDVTIPVSPEDPVSVLDHAGRRESGLARERVVGARVRQEARLGVGRLNASMTPAEARALVSLTSAAARALVLLARGASSRGILSVRKVAATLADLEDAPRVEEHHVQQAWRLRAGQMREAAL